MKDRTPVLYALKKIDEDKLPFQVALEKAEQFYNLSREDKRILFSDVFGVLKKHMLLRLEVKTKFPKYDLNDDEALLLCLALYEMRSAKGVDARKAVLREVVETIKNRGMAFQEEDVDKLLAEASAPFEIPEEYKADPYRYNSFAFNLPAWVIERYDQQFGPEKVSEILKSTLRSPSLFLSVNTQKNKLTDYRGDDRFACLSSADTSSQGGGSLLCKKGGRASNYPEVVEGKLFAQDLSYARAIDAVPLSQYAKVLSLGGKTGTTAASLAMRLCARGGVVTAPFSEGKNLARAKGLFRRLSLSNTKTYLSSMKMVKVNEEYDSYDSCVVTPTSTHLGQARRRPDVTALFSVDRLTAILASQYEALTEASYFPRVGGTLIYLVPTILAEETSDLVARFLKDPTSVNRFSLIQEEVVFPFPDAKTGIASDGLYWALLERTR